MIYTACKVWRLPSRCYGKDMNIAAMRACTDRGLSHENNGRRARETLYLSHDRDTPTLNERRSLN